MALPPQYTLLTDLGEGPLGCWRFVLMRPDGTTELDVTDCEPGVHGLRLELFALVRGLEALDQPSQVLVVTASRSVRHGIEHGLVQWRENGWTWESYDQVEPIKHADLWQRVAAARDVHDIRCAAVARRRTTAVPQYRVDRAQAPGLAPHTGRWSSRLRHVLHALVSGTGR